MNDAPVTAVGRLLAAIEALTDVPRWRLIRRRRARQLVKRRYDVFELSLRLDRYGA